MKSETLFEVLYRYLFSLSQTQEEHHYVHLTDYETESWRDIFKATQLVVDNI